MNMIQAFTEKSFDGKREDGGRAIRQHKVPGESPCLSSQMGTGGNNVPMIKSNKIDIIGNLKGEGGHECHNVHDPNGIAPAVRENHGKTTMVAPTIRAEHHNTADVHFVKKKSSIRRLTPTECARLQGFPDNWNDWQSDTQRYKQFGNAVSVPVISAIAEKMKGIVYAIDGKRKNFN